MVEREKTRKIVEYKVAIDERLCLRDNIISAYASQQLSNTQKYCISMARVSRLHQISYTIRIAINQAF